MRVAVGRTEEWKKCGYVVEAAEGDLFWSGVKDGRTAAESHRGLWFYWWIAAAINIGLLA